MPKYYNTNERYGDGGPYTAPSKEALADEMMPCFKNWALEAWNKLDTLQAETWMEYVERVCQDMREDFIKGLEERR